MEPITISKLILEYVGGNKYIIPAIQRKYVWKEKDICKYFDSIMRNYPIGYIMLWNVNSSFVNSGIISFYKFLDNINASKQEYNSVVGHVANGVYYAVLDGQQRIQSLKVGINGEFIDKNGKSKELYINILRDLPKKENVDLFDDSEENDDDYYLGSYEFKFLNSSNTNEKNKLWFKVKDILNITTATNRKKYFETLEKKLSKEQYLIANTILEKLSQRINNDKVIKIEEINDEYDISQILDIFVRLNSGGEKLSKSDLLFSTVVSKWDGGRKTIDNFISEINKKDTYLDFNITTDFIMRTFLYIRGDDTTMRIDKFGSIAEGIEDDWPKISKAIKKIFQSLRDMDFRNEFISSYNSIIPLVYFAYNNDRKFKQKELFEMKKYVFISQLKHLFGTASNQVLSQTKHALKDKTEFKFSYFDKLLLTNGSFVVTINDIKRWLEYKKDTKEASILLRILYTSINYGSGKYQKDHAHPVDQVNLYLSKHKDCIFLKKYYDCLPNLEYLKDHVNTVVKHKQPLKEWAKKNKVNFTTAKTPLDLDHFEVYYNERRKKMFKKLCREFNVRYTEDDLVDITE